MEPTKTRKKRSTMPPCRIHVCITVFFFEVDTRRRKKQNKNESTNQLLAFCCLAVDELRFVSVSCSSIVSATFLLPNGK